MRKIIESKPIPRLLFILAFPFFSMSQDGSLDISFGLGGITTTPIGVDEDFASAVAIQTDGKIVVAGTNDYGSDNSFTVVRYLTDGTLDLTFDTDGKVSTNLGTPHDYARAVAIQSDGKIVVAGSATIGGFSQFAIVRYNTNGSLDLSFDGDGILVADIPGTDHDYGYSLVLQDDAKIIVLGNGASAGADVISMIRLNSDGSYDTTFDADGIVTTSLGTSLEGAAVTLQLDGKIVAAASRFNGFNDDLALVRYNTDGSLDLSFDTDGFVFIDQGNNTQRATSVAIQLDGKIVIAGYHSNGANWDVIMARRNEDGSADSSFDSDGILINNITEDDLAMAMAILPDGKIVVTGISNIGSDESSMLLKYNTDGSLDFSFDSDGIVITEFGTRTQGLGVTFQTDGKIVVVGGADNGSNWDFVTLRYHNTDYTNVSELENIGKLEIFPNPLNQSTQIHSENYLIDATLTVLNPQGEIVRTEQHLHGNTFVFERKNLAPGLYFLCIHQGDRSIANGEVIILEN